MEFLKMKTPNLVKNNIKKLEKIFPDCVIEHSNRGGEPGLAIDFDQLRQELSGYVVEGNEERYQFTWPGKKQAILTANAPINKTLRPCREESYNFDTTENLYIEGDNLEVLKLLREDYLGKVKMMYIDPPYNTGNDMVYEDDFAKGEEYYIEESHQVDDDGNRLVANTESNGRFHTDWLNMIYPRLKVAHDLLSDDGVIFISIDDNEVHNMRKICDEIFGEKNFFTCFAWVNSLKDEIESDTKFAGTNLGKIKNSHEYILGYTKGNYQINLDAPSSKYIDKLITNGGNNIQQCTIKKGIKCVDKIDRTFHGRIGGDNDYFDIINPEGMIIRNGVLENDVQIEGPLRNPNMLTRFFNGERVIDHKGQELVSVFIGKTGMINTRKLRVGDTPSTVLVGKGTTKNGTLYLKKLFGEKLFDFAKPIELISYLITKGASRDSIIMDFFSGSGTTADSVLHLNSSDGGSRKFILVQIDESTPADSRAFKLGYQKITDIAKERIRLAGNKILEELKANQPDMLADNNIPKIDLGFRVLKLDSSNMKDVYYKPSDVTNDLFAKTEDNIKEDRTDEDLLFQVMLELAVPLSAKIRHEEIGGRNVLVVDDNYLIACFDRDITDEVVTDIAKRKPQYFVMRDSSAMDDSVITNFETIFQTYSKDTVRKIL